MLQLLAHHHKAKELAWTEANGQHDSELAQALHDVDEQRVEDPSRHKYGNENLNESSTTDLDGNETGELGIDLVPGKSGNVVADPLLKGLCDLFAFPLILDENR